MVLAPERRMSWACQLLLFTSLGLIGTAEAQFGVQKRRTSKPAPILAPGTTAPEIQVSNWIDGKGFKLADVRDKGYAVVHFFHPLDGSLRYDLGRLARLNRAFGSKIRVVSIASATKGCSLAEATKAYERHGKRVKHPVGFDDSGKTVKAFGSHARPASLRTCALIGKDGKVLWSGTTSRLQDRYIIQLLSGTRDAAYDDLALKLSNEISQAEANQDGKAMAKVGEQLVEKNPKRALGWTLGFKAAGWQYDEKKAKQIAFRAVKAMESAPFELIEFVESCLLIRRDTAIYHQIALDKVTPLIHDFADSQRVKLAHLRVLAGCGIRKQASQFAEKLVEEHKLSPPDLTELVLQFANTRNSQIFKDVVHRALGHIDDRIRLKEREHYMMLFMAHMKCTGNTAMAKEAGENVLGQLKGSDNDGINNWTWDLITEQEYLGKYDELALFLAEAMEKTGHEVTYYQKDTIALAKYRNGLFAQAVEYQKKAIEGGGRGDGRYERRLVRFQRALEAKQKRSGRSPRPTSRPKK